MIEKRKKKRQRDLNRRPSGTTNRQLRKQRKAVAKAKCKAYDDFYTSLEEKGGQLKAMRIAKQKNRESQDMYQVKHEKRGRFGAVR